MFIIFQKKKMRWHDITLQITEKETDKLLNNVDARKWSIEEKAV